MSKVPITITVDEEAFNEFKKLCDEKDIKISTKINSLIIEWTQNNKKR